MIDANTSLIALLGNPIGHSLSPRMHMAAISHLGLNICYLAFCVPESRFESAFCGLEALGAMGANVTIPFKERAFALVDHSDISAEATGAVNTIVFAENGSVGYNTDVIGIKEALKSLGHTSGSALLLGAGGASRAALHVLAESGFSPIWIVNRSEDRVQKLIKGLKKRLPDAEIEVLPFGNFPPSPSVVINATSLGLQGNPYPEGFVDSLLGAADCAKVLDLVYSPHGATPLVDAARRRGMAAIDGIEVLLHQGAAAFELFTKEKAPLDVMRRAIESRSGGEEA